MKFINWMIDSFASEDVIDLYFILSDLVDITLTKSERCEGACFDSLATHIAEQHDGNDNIPLGKQVL